MTALVTDQRRRSEVEMESGCKCATGQCASGVWQPAECVGFIARSRGPITLGPCKCVGNGQSFHDRTGMCLRCEGSGNAVGANA